MEQIMVGQTIEIDTDNDMMMSMSLAWFVPKGAKRVRLVMLEPMVNEKRNHEETPDGTD